MRYYFNIPEDEQQVDFLETPYYFFKEGFSAKEVNEIEEAAKELEWSRAKTFADKDQKEVDKIRISKLKWINPNSIPNISDKLWGMFEEANANWRFDVRGFSEDYQYTVYYGSNKGFYDWHRDTGSENTYRKISATIQLSDPKEYEGGELEISRGTVTKTCYNKGAVIFFPSLTYHKVNAVTKGERRSLVVWLGGPPLK